jgi:hypothetical protein
MCRINSNPTPLSSMKEVKDTDSIKKLQNAKIHDTTMPTCEPSPVLNPNDAFKGGCKLPNKHPEPIDLGEIIGKLEKFNTKEAVETIRNSKGADRDNALLSFQSKIDNMGEKQLKSVRDYLVKEMASPDNNDDQLLGALLGAVNKEIDSRDNGGEIVRPRPPFPINPGPITGRPFPEPIICGPFPWQRDDLSDKIIPLGLDNDSVKEAKKKE